MPVISYIDAVTMAMRERWNEIPVYSYWVRMWEKGGVFKATNGLYDQFGEDRVIDTPLAESAIAGVELSRHVWAFLAIAEMQFADFIMPAIN